MPVGPSSDEWDVARFERWIRVGVESYVLENAGPVAFPEAAHLILRTGSLTMGLRTFAEGLNALRRDNLKQAVALVLSSLEPRECFVPVVEQLLAIAVSIAAYPVLNVLASKIGDGFFGQPDAEGRDSLFAMTIYSVARLATPDRPDAKRCLYELIASANFEPAHASTALIALCQLDRHGLAEHLSTPGLRTKLDEQFACYDPDGVLRKQVAQEIFGIIGLANLNNALPDLIILDPSASGPSADDWLAEALLFSSDSPLEVVEGRSGVSVRLRTERDVFLPIGRGAVKLPSRRGWIDWNARPAPTPYAADLPIRQQIEESQAHMRCLFPWGTKSYAAQGA